MLEESDMLRLSKTHVFCRAMEIAIKVAIGFNVRQSTVHDPESDWYFKRGF